MKQVLLILTMFFVIVSCNSSNGGQNDISFIKEYGKDTTIGPENFTTIEWETTSIDLGQKKRGPDIDIKFPYKNTGTKPLVIDSVMVTCGCTLFNLPKKPILPGKKGEITVRFVSKEQPLAMMTKHVYVKANTSPSMYHTLAFSTSLIE